MLLVALAWSASGGVAIRSSSVDDVMFAHNGHEQATRKRHILRVTPSGTAADSNFYDCMEITVDIISLYHMTYHPMPDGSSCCKEIRVPPKIRCIITLLWNCPKLFD